MEKRLRDESTRCVRRRLRSKTLNGSYNLYTAISNNVVGLKLQDYESRPNAAMGIYWNLQISVEEISKFQKFVFLQWSICFSFRETFLVSFLSLFCGSNYFFKCKCGEKGSFFFTCLKRKET